MTIQWNARALLVAGLVCFNLMVLVVSGVLLNKSRALYEEQAAMQTQNIAKALDQSISGSIEKIDITLHTVADEFERQLAADGKVDEEAMNAFMDRQARRLPEIEGLRASNEAGLIFLGKGVDRNSQATLADRDYFSYHRDHAERAVQVSKPLVGRVSKKRAIFFTQRYSYPDGRFAGVVVATFLLEHFEHIFSRFDLGAHGAIGLRDRDLGLVARAPAIPAGPIGQSAVSPELAKLYETGVPSGTVRAVVAVDGIERTTTFRRLERAPMMVLVGMAKEDYLAKWHTEIYQAFVTIVVFLSFSVLLGGWLLRLLTEAGKRERLLAKSRDDLLNYKDQLEETVQKRTAELMLARDAAEAANKAKSVFLANMSHELRTPLNAILGFSSMMKREPHLSESQRENIDIINRSGTHLLTLINDVLEIAKIEAGRLQLEIAPFDLLAMVRDVADMMQQRAREKGLQLLLEVTPEVPQHIKGDEARLRQILINLVGNAVKFTRQGGVTIRVGIHRNARFLLIIEVEDSGPGIGEEDQKRIFRPFVQLAEGGEQKGTGLGLAITKQFVDLMGGSIDLDSTVGKGSLFRAELPVEPAVSLELPEIQNEVHGAIVGLVPGQPAWRILIAEDQHENQQLLNWLMTDIGIETRLVENGEECIKEFLDWHPDLIWMDRRMPVMDGEEATRQIRKLPGGDKVRIVAVTASAFKEEQQQMLDAGMDDFVRKPYRPDEIYDCLAKQLNVCYRYESGNGGQAEPAVLTQEMLAGLPAVLRQELKEAVSSLDSERIAVAIGKAAEVDGELGRSLVRLVDQYDYPAVLAALEACESA